MTGCLQEKNGKNYIVLNVYENGKRKRKWIPTGLLIRGNKRKAEQMLREKLLEYEQSEGTIRSDVLFSDFVRQWLTVAKRKVDAVTLQGYENIARTHVLPYFDALGTRLQDVTFSLLQAYIDEKQAHGRKDGKGGLSARSLLLHKNVLSQTLDEAVKAGLLPANPCHYVTLPRQERHEAQFYNEKQLQALFEAIHSEVIYPLVKITALYGLRRSELLGLKWDSLDLDAGMLTIRHTVTKVSQVVEKDKTKNASSYRSFPLTDEAREIFLAAKASQTENRRLFGKDYFESDYIFTWPDGRPFSPDYLTKKFAKLLRQHDLPHIRFHELRHSCASLLLNNGFGLKDVQEWLGHSDIKMTANIYGHLDVARKQSIAERLSGSLAKGW